MARAPANRYAGGGPSPSGLADVLDLILDRGVVVDAYVRVSLAGIELLTIDARIVVASVDTYLRFAAAVERLNLADAHETPIEFARTARPRMEAAASGGVIDTLKQELVDALPDEEER